MPLKIGNIVISGNRGEYFGKVKSQPKDGSSTSGSKLINMKF